MIDYDPLYQAMAKTKLKNWVDDLHKNIHAVIFKSAHGDMESWLNLLSRLPKVIPSSVDLNSSCIRVGDKNDCSDDTRDEINRLLRNFHPWRKGPFSVFNIDIDTEWRSDMKWDRFKTKIQPLKDRVVLDVGCGSGYHCWRMCGDDAELVIGIDPTLRYVMQFHTIQHYINNPAVHVLPLNIDDVPEELNAFDTVFSMGVLYHRRSPLDHLYQLKGCLKQGGELVLETLVIEGEQGEVLVPEGRYAKMRNVWFIPSCLTLERWLLRCGFSDVNLIDVNQTSIEEQRITDWMRFESLSNFLDPENANLTAEGYPAPKRAIFTAKL